MPVFAIDGGLPLVLARGCANAGTLLVFGTLMFGSVVAPRALVRAPTDVADEVQRLLRQLAWLEVVLCFTGTLAWLVVEARTMAAAVGWGGTARALSAVGLGTWFGGLVLVSLATSVSSVAVLGRGKSVVRWRGATIVAGIGTAVQAGHAHALAMYSSPSLLLLSDVVHLFSAGVWLGGLPALLLIVHRAPPRTGAAAARWFSPIGKWCVFGVVVSAAFQSWSLIGDVSGLIGTAYGWAALAKVVLFAMLLGFAVINRYRLAPALLTAEPTRARRALVRSVAVQTGVGLLAVFAAATLASLPPAIHEQPLWPFPLRPSLVATEDPDLRHEIALALLGIAAAIAIASVGFMWRRVRWAGSIVSIGLVVLAAPHLDLLFVEAYPTTFFRSPTGFATASIVHGAKLFASNCVACHGVEGKGDGSLARSLPVSPADLTAAHLWDHSDGELFWWLSRGMAAPEGAFAMPGFAEQLTESDRWDLIDAVRAHNAGVAMHETGTWSHPVPAPAFSAVCSGGRRVDLADLRGRVVRLIVGGGDEAPNPPPSPSQAGIEIVDVHVSAASEPRGGDCVARDPTVLDALAILTGERSLAGEQFLIDPAGWLRARWRPGQPGGWDEATSLLAEVQSICTHPINFNGVDHAHHH